MGMPGPLELIIILVIVVLVFGGKRLKNLGGDLGGAIKGFKKSMKDEAAEKELSRLKKSLKPKPKKRKLVSSTPQIFFTLRSKSLT